MIELTEQQQRELDTAETPRAVDPRTGQTYILLGEECYDRLLGLLEENIGLTRKEAAVLVKRATKESDVNGDATPDAAQDTFPGIGTNAWGLMNRRRAELIHKKNRQGLTPEERTEYERLQSLSRAALEAAFPAPLLDEERLNRLEARLNAAEGKKE